MENKCDFVWHRELYHHGILGQEWGKKNGPPYPLGYQAHSSKEKVKNNKARLDNYGDGKKPLSSKLRDKSKPFSNKTKKINNSSNEDNNKSKNVSNEGQKSKKLTDSQKKMIAIGATAAVAAVAAYGTYKLYEAGKLDSFIYGREKTDQIIKDGSLISRIQSNDLYEGNHALYVTYNQNDMDEYAGLYGKALIDRSKNAADVAAKLASKTGDPKDIARAAELKKLADEAKSYKLDIKAVGDLKIPSEKNASILFASLMKNNTEFSSDASKSIDWALNKGPFKRPNQIALFKQAQKYLNKGFENLSDKEKTIVYRAFNISLVDHGNDFDLRAQSTFYNHLKTSGYDALTDINDRLYSSYHSKHPVIVFNTDKLLFDKATALDEGYMKAMSAKYNAKRMLDEVPQQIITSNADYLSYKLSDAASFIDELIQRQQ